jgi:hypothetical protein
MAEDELVRAKINMAKRSRHMVHFVLIFSMENCEIYVTDNQKEIMHSIYCTW